MSIIRFLEGERPEVAGRLVRDFVVGKFLSPQTVRGIECTLRVLLSEVFDKSNPSETQRWERICSTLRELGSTKSVSALKPSMVDGEVRAIECGLVVVEFAGSKVSR